MCLFVRNNTKHLVFPVCLSIHKQDTWDHSKQHSNYVSYQYTPLHEKECFDALKTKTKNKYRKSEFKL